MPAKRFVILFILSALLPAAAVAGIVWRVDPYQHFRAADHYPDDIFYLAPGLARHQDYQIVVTGNSYAQNLVPSRVAAAFGAPAINLSLNGSTLYDQRRLLETALATGRVRQVVWGLDFDAAAAGPGVPKLRADFPGYLYDDTPWNDAAYLFNRDTLALSWEMARHPERHRADPDRFNTWFGKPKNAPGRDRVIADFFAKRAGVAALTPGERRAMEDAFRPAWLLMTFEQEVMALVAAHPEVRFTFYLPPFSVLHYAYLTEWNAPFTLGVLRFQEQAMERLSRAPNCRVFYFDTVRRVTHNLAHYKDTTHFSVAVSDWLLAEFGREHYRVRPGQAHARVAAFTEQLLALDLPALLAAPSP